MKRNIEFVCSGNNGRSPVAEAVANRVIRTLGLENELGVCSSGTYVNFQGDLKSTLRPFIDKAVYKRILDPEVAERFEQDPGGVFREITKYEALMRDQYLLDSLGESYVHTPTQTIIRPQAELILPIDSHSTDRVKHIYKGSSCTPLIQQLGEYSGLGWRLESDFPCTEQEYRKSASEVETATRVAILKALEIN